MLRQRSLGELSPIDITWGQEVWWSNVLNSAFPPQWLRLDWSTMRGAPRPEHQDLISHAAGVDATGWTLVRRAQNYQESGHWQVKPQEKRPVLCLVLLSNFQTSAHSGNRATGSAMRGRTGSVRWVGLCRYMA